MSPKKTFCGALAALVLAASQASAGPMVEVGDSALRSDILLLANAGLIDNVTMQWPMPWESILNRLQRADLSAQPAYVRAAAERVIAKGSADSAPNRQAADITLDATSSPSVIRGFDAMGISKFQGQMTGETSWETTTLHLAVGGRTKTHGDRQVLDLDGTYVDQRLGPVELYAGYKSHWWGPGWISALSQSNNARPMPQVGITRSRTDAFESPWLSWLGPWQAELFVGLLNGKRDAKDTGFVGFRFAFNPLPGLEIGFARTTEMCGSGHSCSPLKDYFSIANDEKHTNNTNDQGNIDIRYSGTLGEFSYETYVQFMNEDTNPFQHSGSSHLFGASLWTGLPGGSGRLTAEYTDSVATHDLWGAGTMSGFAYNNGSYYDGWRYRGRSMGFSLDSNSRLLSFQAQYVRTAGDSYSLSFHHAEINTGGLVADTEWRNVVSDTPVILNMVEARVRWPFAIGEHNMAVELAGRVQDDQPRPDHGWLTAVESKLVLPL